MNALLAIGFALNSIGNEGRTFDLRCKGLEEYAIVLKYGVDFGYGTITSKRNRYNVELDTGFSTAALVPEERRAGLRWMKVEKIGKATLCYGYDVKKRMLEATIFGCPITMQCNLAAPATDQKHFVAIARALAAATCTHTAR